MESLGAKDKRALAQWRSRFVSSILNRFNCGIIDCWTAAPRMYGDSLASTGIPASSTLVFREAAPGIGGRRVAAARESAHHPENPCIKIASSNA